MRQKLPPKRLERIDETVEIRLEKGDTLGRHRIWLERWSDPYIENGSTFEGTPELKGQLLDPLRNAAPAEDTRYVLTLADGRSLTFTLDRDQIVAASSLELP